MLHPKLNPLLGAIHQSWVYLSADLTCCFRKEIFTPMYFFVARKPQSDSSKLGVQTVS